MQREIQESAYRWQQAVDRGDNVVVGVNRFRGEEDLELDRLRHDLAVGERQAERLQALRDSRDNETTSVALSKLEIGARSDDNLVPLILRAVEMYATIGEICNVLRGVFGEYQAPSVF
jgi:methylmalonyl-CoA mutase N-terminal domain/subunit